MKKKREKISVIYSIADGAWKNISELCISDTETIVMSEIITEYFHWFYMVY